MSLDRNLVGYRATVRATAAPFIPYLGMFFTYSQRSLTGSLHYHYKHNGCVRVSYVATYVALGMTLTDLTFADEGNASTLLSRICFSKYQRLSGIITSTPMIPDGLFTLYMTRYHLGDHTMYRQALHI